MRINSKKAYYFFVIGIGIISLLITLKILRSYNKPPSLAGIKNILGLYSNKISKNNNFYEKKKIIKKDETEKPFNITDNITQYYYPFKINFIQNTNIKVFNFNYNEKKNELNFENFDLLNEEEYNKTLFPILDLFSINTNSSQSINITLENNIGKIPVYRTINVYFIKDELYDKKRYDNMISFINEYFQNNLFNSNFKLFIKYINYKNKIPFEENQSLYSSLKEKNSKLFFDELNDKEIINIILYDKINKELKYPIYNQDLSSFIFFFDFKKFKKNDFSKLINLISLTKIIPSYLFKKLITNTNTIKELEKLFNSKKIREHILLIATLRNLEKLNKIFSLYETIKTIENVKEKLNIIHNIFTKFLKQKFEGDISDDLNEIYIISQYLMESNQLVLFEHYFSDEFKVGQFLPIMLPIIYGFIKAFKAIAF